VCLKQRAGVIAHVDRRPKSGGYGIGGDVIMGRPDPARGEHMGIGPAQRVQRGDDGGVFIRDDPHLGQGDALVRQLPCQVMHVGVTGAA